MIFRVAEESPAPATASWRGGCIVALAFGFVIVAIFYGVCAIVIGGPRGGLSWEEWPFLLVQILIAGAPFGVLVVKRIKAKLPWLVAGILTLCFWSMLAYSVSQAARDETGANIGMGWTMLVSPLVIAGAALLASKATRVAS